LIGGMQQAQPRSGQAASASELELGNELGF